MLAAIEIYAMDRNMVPVGLDSFTPAEIHTMLNYASELRKDNNILRNREAKRVSFTHSTGDGQSFAVDVNFL